MSRFKNAFGPPPAPNTVTRSCAACFAMLTTYGRLNKIGFTFTKELRQYRIILSADTASEVRQLPERCLSRKAGIMRYCPKFSERSGTLSTVQFIMGDSQPPIFPSSFLQSLPNLSRTSQTEMTKNARSQYRVIGLRDCKEHYRGKCSII